MNITDEGLDLIKRFEGLALEAYQDIADVWTIGYGHTTGVTPGQRITEAEAEQLLREEVERFENGVERAVDIELNPNEFSALVSFSYNVGLGALGSSTALRRLNAGDRIGAADALLWWNKATVNGQKVEVRGLTRRRAAERALFLKPYPDVGFIPEQVSVEENSRLTAEEGGPRRENLAESRTLQGASAAGVTGLGTVAMGQHQAHQAREAKLEEQDPDPSVDCTAEGAAALPECQETPAGSASEPEAAPETETAPSAEEPVVELPPGEEPVILDETVTGEEVGMPDGPAIVPEEVYQDIYMQLFAAAGLVMILNILWVIWARIDDWNNGKR
ncbi:MAG: glycoside hydrolase family protein [Pseudomonadota bacterium]